MKAIWLELVVNSSITSKHDWEQYVNGPYEPQMTTLKSSHTPKAIINIDDKITSWLPS